MAIKIWEDELRPFMSSCAPGMLVRDPVNIMTACISLPEIPGWVSVVLNPIDFLNEQLTIIKDQTSDILNPLNAMVTNSCDQFFKAGLGMSIDEFTRYYTLSEIYAPNFLGEINTMEILLLLNIREHGYLSDQDCSVIYNSIVTNKLILLNTENLNQLMIHYNAPDLYSRPDTMPNVMLGFVKSLDGNHQWRRHAPSAPVYEPDRSFGLGMPLWTDCQARENFFEKVFKDWEHRGVSIVYADDSEPCM